MITALALLLAGLLLLTLAADRFVLAAARLSRAWGMSPILIGALVVGLGTSAPELLVSVLAAGRGELDLAIGNVVGSNTANVTLVLGTTALVGTIFSRGTIVRREGGLMLLAVVTFSFLLLDLEMNRWEAAGLFGGMVVAAFLLIRWARRDAARGRAPDPDVPEAQAVFVPRELIMGTLTLGLTLLGAEFLVRGAGLLADEVGISDAFVGLVIVSVGTSLPELATALAAARRSETDLVLGNVLGSNLFNTLMVAGTAGLVGPGPVDDTFGIAAGFMAGSALLAGVLVLTGRRLVRWEGAVLLTIFLAFVGFAV
ncbi:MAG: calcium/sodium antiporter [Acidimicrobiia bacterium]|nr:calcium/sodium antiporter [Acidimicrobiia bacterium]